MDHDLIVEHLLGRCKCFIENILRASPSGLVIRPRSSGRTIPKWSIGDLRNVGCT
jgi:hypothetical protein